jgi:thymidylate kinase
MLLSFPRYNTPVGLAIVRHLKGFTMVIEHMTARAPEDALVFQCMMVADKYHAASEAEQHLRKGGHVVCDRWWQSAFVYGKSDKLDPTWLMEVHGMMPVADLNILIDVPAVEASGRRPVARDRYEASMRKREEVRELYLEAWDVRAAARQVTSHSAIGFEGTWEVIDGTRTVGEVHDRIWDLVLPLVEEDME